MKTNDRPPRPSLVDPDEVVKLVREGKSYAEISEATGVSRASISRAFNRSTGQRLRKSRVDVVKVIKLRADGLKGVNIAKQMGYSPKTIYSVLSRQNASISSSSHSQAASENRISSIFAGRVPQPTKLTSS